jgi:hypothetical protein
VTGARLPPHWSDGGVTLLEGHLNSYFSLRIAAMKDIARAVTFVSVGDRGGRAVFGVPCDLIDDLIVALVEARRHALLNFGAQALRGRGVGPWQQWQPPPRSASLSASHDASDGDGEGSAQVHPHHARATARASE